MKPLTLAISAAVLFITVRVATAQGFPANSPEAVAQQYFERMRAGNWTDVADLTHPDALQRFRDMIVPVVLSDTTGKLAPVFGATDNEAFKKATPRDVFLGVLKMYFSQPQVKQTIAAMKAQVLGHVAEGDDITHVVYRGSAGMAGVTFEQVDVISLRRQDGAWRAMLTGNIEGLAQALGQAIKK